MTHIRSVPTSAPGTPPLSTAPAPEPQTKSAIPPRPTDPSASRDNARQVKNHASSTNAARSVDFPVPPTPESEFQAFTERVLGKDAAKDPQKAQAIRNLKSSWLGKYRDNLEDLRKQDPMPASATTPEAKRSYYEKHTQQALRQTRRFYQGFPAFKKPLNSASEWQKVLGSAAAEYRVYRDTGKPNAIPEQEKKGALLASGSSVDQKGFENFGTNLMLLTDSRHQKNIDRALKARIPYQVLNHIRSSDFDQVAALTQKYDIQHPAVFFQNFVLDTDLPEHGPQHNGEVVSIADQLEHYAANYKDLQQLRQQHIHHTRQKRETENKQYNILDNHRLKSEAQLVKNPAYSALKAEHPEQAQALLENARQYPDLSLLSAQDLLDIAQSIETGAGSRDRDFFSKEISAEDKKQVSEIEHLSGIEKQKLLHFFENDRHQTGRAQMLRMVKSPAFQSASAAERQQFFENCLDPDALKTSTKVDQLKALSQKITQPLDAAAFKALLKQEKSADLLKNLQTLRFDPQISKNLPPDAHTLIQQSTLSATQLEALSDTDFEALLKAQQHYALPLDGSTAARLDQATLNRLAQFNQQAKTASPETLKLLFQSLGEDSVSRLALHQARGSLTNLSAYVSGENTSAQDKQALSQTMNKMMQMSGLSGNFALDDPEQAKHQFNQMREKLGLDPVEDISAQAVSELEKQQAKIDHLRSKAAHLLITPQNTNDLLRHTNIHSGQALLDSMGPSAQHWNTEALNKMTQIIEGQLPPDAFYNKGNTDPVLQMNAALRALDRSAKAVNAENIKDKFLDRSHMTALQKQLKASKNQRLSRNDLEKIATNIQKYTPDERAAAAKLLRPEAKTLFNYLDTAFKGYDRQGRTTGHNGDPGFISLQEFERFEHKRFAPGSGRDVINVDTFVDGRKTARILNRAMERDGRLWGAGTDDPVVRREMGKLSASGARIDAVSAEYKSMYGQSLERALKSDLSWGDEADALYHLSSGGADRFARQQIPTPERAEVMLAGLDTAIKQIGKGNGFAAWVSGHDGADKERKAAAKTIYAEAQAALKSWQADKTEANAEHLKNKVAHLYIHVGADDAADVAYEAGKDTFKEVGKQVVVIGGVIAVGVATGGAGFGLAGTALTMTGTGALLNTGATLEKQHDDKKEVHTAAQQQQKRLSAQADKAEQKGYQEELARTREAQEHIEANKTKQLAELEAQEGKALLAAMLEGAVTGVPIGKLASGINKVLSKAPGLRKMVGAKPLQKTLGKHFTEETLNQVASEFTSALQRKDEGEVKDLLTQQINNLQTQKNQYQGQIRILEAQQKALSERSGSQARTEYSKLQNDLGDLKAVLREIEHSSQDLQTQMKSLDKNFSFDKAALAFSTALIAKSSVSVARKYADEKLGSYFHSTSKLGELSKRVTANQALGLSEALSHSVIDAIASGNDLQLSVNTLMERALGEGAKAYVSTAEKSLQTLLNQTLEKYGKAHPGELTPTMRRELGEMLAPKLEKLIEKALLSSASLIDTTHE